MIEWTDRAVMLSARPFGEGKAVAHALTEAHGRHAGLVQGARRQSALRGRYHELYTVQARI